eukprot:COSAG03_NODE_1180_length_4634_cov_1.858655_5_plen_141_part_00
MAARRASVQFSPSPLNIQDEEGRFPREVARVQGVPVAVFEYLVASNPTAENYHRLIDAIETQEWLLVVNIIGQDPHTTSIEGKPASPGSVQVRVPWTLLWRLEHQLQSWRPLHVSCQSREGSWTRRGNDGPRWPHGPSVP